MNIIRSRRRCNRIAFAVALAFALLTIEFGARYWLLVNAPPTYVQFRMGRPAGYAESDYYGPDFLDEQGRFAASIQADLNGMPSGGFAGRYYNMANGIRRTTDQPDSYAHTIYMFGNSTLASVEVPDNYTIPSYLQRAFNEVGLHYRIVNLGVGTKTLRQELQRMKTLILRPGDTIVFYAGVADAYWGFQFIETERDLTLAGKLCNSLSPFIGRFGTVELFCYMVDRNLPSPNTKSLNLQSFQYEYHNLMLEAKNYALSQRCSFYYFLQPHLWTKPLSVYEQAINDNPNLTPVGLPEHFAQMWPTLQTARSGMPGTDLTHILDQTRRSGVELFVDDHHITERGNAIVARALFDALTLI